MTLLSSLSLSLPENIPSIVRASGTSITLAATNLGQQTRIAVGPKVYSPQSGLSLATGSTGAGGLDTGSLAAGDLWYVYAIVQTSTNNLNLVASKTAPATGPSMPSGYASGVWRVVGRFLVSSTPDVSHVVPLGSPFVEYAWNGSGIASGNDTSSFGWGATGKAFNSITSDANFDVQFASANTDIDEFALQVKAAAAHWTTLGPNDNSGLMGYTIQNGTTYGLALTSSNVATNRARVTFGSRGYNNSTFGAAGIAFSSFTNYFWRVRKLSPGDVLR